MTNEYAMKRRKMNDAVDTDFHAGHFLRQLLQEQGHDVPWLAERTDSDTDALDLLLEQADMDAKLFVSLGLPLQPLFMQRVDEMIFGKQPGEPVN